ALLDTVPAALEAAARGAKQVASGSQSLFGEAPASLRERDLTLSEVPDFDPPTQLQMEKEVLGMFISGHPLEKYRGRFKGLAAVPIARLRDSSDSEKVAVVGYVSQFSIRISKRGNRYAQGVIEDLGGTVEFRAFRELEPFSDMGAQRIGFFEGRVQKDLYEEESEDRKPSITYIVEKATFDRGRRAEVKEAPEEWTPDATHGEGAVAAVAVEPQIVQVSEREPDSNGNGAQAMASEAPPAVTGRAAFRVILQAGEISAPRLEQLRKAILANAGEEPVELVLRTPTRDFEVALGELHRVNRDAAIPALQALGFGVEV
ncbi:MAG: hypothetical protein ACREDU_12525, partial [Methylocella sp.]